MKWAGLFYVVLIAGCATGQRPNPVTPSGPLLPPALPEVAKTSRPLTRTSFATPDGASEAVVRDVYVVGVVVEHAYWNGLSYDLPVAGNWFQIYVPNPTQAAFVQLDWSSDLMSWTNLGYFRGYTNGIWLVDPTAHGRRMGFYRLGTPGDGPQP